MKSCATALLALGLLLTGCGTGTPTAVEAPTTVRDADLEMLLLGVDDVNEVMGTALTPEPVVDGMADNRNLLTNKNCLGVWGVDEAAIYGERDSGTWSAVRSQTLRAPADDTWDNLAVQSVVSYATPEAAQTFFTESADRWAQCTDHTVNINLNGQQLPKWRSGQLVRTGDRLTLPIARGTGDQTRSCERVLAVKSNVVSDVEACRPRTFVVDQAARIADTIQSRIG
ncbi:sensor domain-containing protein [Mycolicibacterium sp. S2-37]|uniref:sensor domain-containing protein n=1 Tax=Mycolicibacterium sp. S2-37 TaxID=2810297 RepID=UPI001A94A65E|nr:sensor domain-containing protein [Mycolicibacterium sp. S2-37]MBO0677555.1 sensor domain-containing protein [Mycolicibacterium sp. S2-37]